MCFIDYINRTAAEASILLCLLYITKAFTSKAKNTDPSDESVSMANLSVRILNNTMDYRCNRKRSPQKVGHIFL